MQPTAGSAHHGHVRRRCVWRYSHSAAASSQLADVLFSPRRLPLADEISAVVIDIGTHTTRAGYAGEEAPRCAIPTAYGWKDVEVEVDDGDAVTGSGAQNGGSHGGDIEMKDANGDGHNTTEAQAAGSSKTKKKTIVEKRYYMGENGAAVWREGMEVDNMMRDGISKSGGSTFEVLDRGSRWSPQLPTRNPCRICCRMSTTTSSASIRPSILSW